ncbi:hypothetical protein CL630_02795 [bacterium]|nr:hypothetical protein [bacterium]|tara:strand:+ start:107 stop:676 length:570 start_codon:yes stop_codon:yes gene_type:complete
MVNLLPTGEKLRIRKIYKARLLISALVFSFVVGAVGAAALLPAFFWSFVKDREARQRLVVVEQVISIEERKNIRESVADANQKIVLLAETKGKISPIHEIIETILARKTSGIALTAFFSEQKSVDGKERAMTLSGISQNRSTLLFFVNELREEDIFTEVNVPVSNFAKNRDIPFSISILLISNSIPLQI